MCFGVAIQSEREHSTRRKIGQNGLCRVSDSLLDKQDGNVVVGDGTKRRNRIASQLSCSVISDTTR